MPLNNGCRLDQHHGVQGLRPNPVRPHPEEPVSAEQPRATRPPPPQDGHLMSQSEQLKLQRSAATKAKREQRSEGGKICDYADKGMAGMQKSPRFLHTHHTLVGMITYLSALASLLSFRFRSRASLELELLALRHQVIVLRRQRPGRLRLFCADRLLWVWLYRIWPQALNAMVLVKPTTVVQWLSLIHISEPTRQAEISYAVFC